MRSLTHFVSLSLAFALGLMSSIVYGQTPKPSDTDEDLFVYKMPVTSTGMVQVYVGASGKYVRTTPFHLHSRRLLTDRKYLEVNASIALTEREKTELEAGLNRHVQEVNGAPPAVSAAALTWVAPFYVKARLLGPDGAVITRSTKPSKDDGSPLEVEEVKSGSLAMEYEKPLSFRFKLPTPIAGESQLDDYQMTFEATYKVRTAKVQYGAFQQVTSEITRAYEKVFGGRAPESGEFVSRNAVQTVAEDKLVRGSLISINSKQGDEELLLGMLKTSIADPLSLNDTNWDKLPKKWVVWTPELGRLEIAPTQQNFEENEKALRQSSESEFLSKAKHLSDEARDNKTFDKWYNLQHYKRAEKGSGSGSLKTEADILDIVSGGTNGTAAYNFDKSLNELGVTSGERERYEKVRQLLQDETEVQNQAKSKFETWWKGKNQIVSTMAKSFELFAVRSASSTTEKLIEITRRILGDVENKTIPFAEYSLNQATTVVDSIAEIQTKLDGLLKSVKEQDKAVADYLHKLHSEGILAAPVQRAPNTAYTAETDGFIIAWTGGNQEFRPDQGALSLNNYALSDNENEIAKDFGARIESGSVFSMSCLIRRGQPWRAKFMKGTNLWNQGTSVQWIPIQTAPPPPIPNR